MLKVNIQEFIEGCKGNVAVAIKHLGTGECVLINENKVFPSASVIKLTIMSTFMQRVKEGKLKLDDTVLLDGSFTTGGDGILKELSPGHTFTYRELIKLMIIVSDNLATNLLIDLLGMDEVNKQCKDLALEHAKLQRKMMDSDARKNGRENYICASDALRILELIYNGNNVDASSSELMLDFLKRQQVGGRLQLYLPEDVLVAHKTGDLDCLEHDVGIVYLPDSEYIICVLTNETDTNKDGREIIGKISRMAYDYFNK